ncbi:MAG: 16S rRNA (cytidine(1402)-2'-O)-methyltransferase [Phascolarctobacterium sp.]|nr:16S rRNA (cytidine(1402)-2'-O)-methyltransferase [Phascolarctobacterium sp.]
MEKGKIFYGTLYLCATPIGNLEDMTPRALRILSEADIVAAEDTRHTLQLLNRFEIKKHLVRYDEHTKKCQGDFLLQELKAGKNVALVSDAGFPGIADPGENMALKAISEGINVIPVPGANAALSALVVSGLPATPFFFGGFLPKTKKKRREQLKEWCNMPATTVLYEAPHRIEEVLRDILEIWGDRSMTAARELTKLHEEIFRSSVSGCLKWLEEQPPRGEFCLVIGKSGDVPQNAKKGDPFTEAKGLLDRGIDRKTALAEIAKKYKIPKRELYNRLISEEGIKE